MSVLMVFDDPGCSMEAWVVWAREVEYSCISVHKAV